MQCRSNKRTVYILISPRYTVPAYTTYFECKQCISRAIPLRRSKANSVDSDQHHCAVVCQLTIDLWQTMKFLIRSTSLPVFLYTSVTPLFWRGLTEYRREHRYRSHARTSVFSTGTCVFSQLYFILKLVVRSSCYKTAIR